MRLYSACIEWLFAEEGDIFADRIRRAHDAGLKAIEFWRWTEKDLDSIEAALKETGLKVTSLVAEPMIALTNAANRDTWLKGLADSVAVARRLGAPVLIAQAGDDLEGVTRDEQRKALTETLRAGADILKDSGVRLGVEPLNIRIDHIGYFLDSTREGLDIVDDVARPEIGIVYDIYHSAVMDERTEEVLSGRINFYFLPLAPALSLVKEGKVVALAVGAAKRSPDLPDVPTMAESGLPDAAYHFWGGLFVPVKTPRQIVNKLNAETAKALEVPSVRERLTKMATQPMPMSPDQFAKYFQDDVASTLKLAKEAGMQPTN